MAIFAHARSRLARRARGSLAHHGAGRCARAGCPPLAALPRDLPGRPHDRLRVQGRHLHGPRVRRRRQAPDAGRVPRVRAGVEPRRSLHRVRLRPLRQLRRVRHAGHGRRGHAPHLPLDRGDPEHLHGGRPGGALLGLPPGAGYQRPVPHGPDDAALVRAGDGWARGDGAAGSGRQRHARRVGRQAGLRGREGLRGSMAEAPHVGGHPRRLGLRPRGEDVPPALAVRRRGPQPGLRRGRRPLLLPERAERVVQRVPELAVRPRHQHGGHALRPEPGALPHPRGHRHALLRFPRRDLHDGARRGAGEGGDPHRRRRTERDRRDRAGERALHRGHAVPEREGVRLRVPRARSS